MVVEFLAPSVKTALPRSNWKAFICWFWTLSTFYCLCTKKEGLQMLENHFCFCCCSLENEKKDSWSLRLWLCPLHVPRAWSEGNTAAWNICTCVCPAPSTHHTKHPNMLSIQHAWVVVSSWMQILEKVSLMVKPYPCLLLLWWLSFSIRRYSQ